jgi:DNA primase
MAGLIPPSTLEQIRSASDIVDVIGGYIPLKRAGANFVALCPFHKEKTPSFNVNPQRQIFHCFGCHKGGDVFTFVREYEGLNFLDAVRRLAERARIPLEFDARPGQAETRQIKDLLLEIHEQVAQRWHAVLTNDAAGQGARDYLARRRVPDEAVKLFRLGCAPDAWDDTVNWARSKGFDPAVVAQAGLILRKEGTDHYYDRFRGRLIFPICDEQGRVIGFSGRVLAGDEKTAKYVNSPETPIFTKGRVFYGLDKTKRALLDTGSAVICEGQLDLIACFMAGVKNVVAPQGTAFTPDHARILSRYVQEVVLCFDSDTAGQAAAVRVLDSLLGAGLAIRVALVPAPHDPDSYIKEAGGPAFQELVARAEGFFDFYLKLLCRQEDVSTDKGRLQVLRSMGEAVNKTGNRVLVDTYAQKTALRLAVSPDAVRDEFRKARRASAAPPAASEAAPSAEEVTTPIPTHEAWLLKLLLLHEDVVPWAASHLRLEWISDPRTRFVVEKRFDALRSSTWNGPAGLVSELDPVLAALVTGLLADPRGIPNAGQQLRDLAVRLRNQHLDREIANLARRLSLPETAEADRVEMLRQQAALRQAKRQPVE